jgi:GTP-binding protein EngB required for normal cell division
VATVPDVPELLDALDLAIARSEDIVTADLRGEMVDLARRSRLRSGFLGEVLVVALAGGTGSGKSSLINALVGFPVVETGVVRPTTQTATAVVPPRMSADLGPLLDALGVEQRITDRGVDDFVFIDLPDFDSIEKAHRHVVDDVMPRVDAVVWVLDPEKYADPVLHDQFLASLTGYESQFIFALNQADRLGDDLDEAMDTLGALLAEDGFVDPRMCATTARTSSGAFEIEALTAAIGERLDTKRTAIAKLAIDSLAIAGTGWGACRAIDVRNAGDVARDRVALGAATFVSLGVTAFGLKHAMVGGEHT